jgi:hypothetical protein
MEALRGAFGPGAAKGTKSVRTRFASERRRRLLRCRQPRHEPAGVIGGRNEHGVLGNAHGAPRERRAIWRSWQIQARRRSCGG